MLRAAQLAALLLAALNANAPADDDLDAIRREAGTYEKAFNAGDAKALAAMFTPEARMIDAAGEVVAGREAIEARYREVFATPGLKIEVTVGEVRRLGLATIREEGTAVVTAPDGSREMTDYTALHVRDGDAWRMAEVRETPSADEAADAEPLADFAWMLGEWVDEGSDAVIKFEGAWDHPERRRFLIRKFEVRVDGKVVLDGTQRIGWDADLGQARGWVFDSGGGFAEQTWYAEGPGRWLVHTKGVDAEGLRGSASHRVTLDGDSSVRVEISDRTLGGESIPGTDEHHLTRTPPKPAHHAPAPTPTTASAPQPRP